MGEKGADNDPLKFMSGRKSRLDLEEEVAKARELKTPPEVRRDPDPSYA
jgi:hypothetical protein